MADSRLFVVQGLFFPNRSKFPGRFSRALKERAQAIAEQGESLGVLSHEQLTGGNRGIANRLLRMARGTARAVDAAEVFEVDEKILRQSLRAQKGRDAWQEMAGCANYGFDASRSFVLMGKLRLLVDGPFNEQRVLWFGRGLRQLSDKELIDHYTGHHGPLVASHADVLGIISYRQVANDHEGLCDTLRGLGLGRAPPPPVFAQLAMTTPPLGLDSLRARRLATREIKADEKRHIDFGRSMLLLV